MFFIRTHAYGYAPQAIARLSQGLTLQQTTNEFHVHLNSIETWRQRWNKQGLIGLYEGHHTERRRKWTFEQQEALRTLALADGGSGNSLLHTMAQTEGLPAISQETARRYLHEMQFSYKRYRYSLKKVSRRVRQGREGQFCNSDTTSTMHRAMHEAQH